MSLVRSRRRFFGHGLPGLEPAALEGKLVVIEGSDGVGRSTHIQLLREWFEVRGHAVVETGWTRSKLMSKTIAAAKAGHSLNRLTFALLYATDFADRLEHEVIPALKSGFIVLADRYVYTAFARARVRGLDPLWIRNLFGFAPVPDLVFHLRLDVATLVKRVLGAKGLDYWESGADLYPGLDLYDAFRRYQARLLREYDRLGVEYGFRRVSARPSPERVQAELRRLIEAELFVPAEPGLKP